MMELEKGPPQLLHTASILLGSKISQLYWSHNAEKHPYDLACNKQVLPVASTSSTTTDQLISPTLPGWKEETSSRVVRGGNIQLKKTCKISMTESTRKKCHCSMIQWLV